MSYNESSITWFKSDLHKIRAKPNMYIGSNDSFGLFTILRELCDNSVDEFQAGHNKIIHIEILDNGSIIVADKGRGIPCGMHPKAKVSTLTVALTSLQSSGKMSANGKDYTTSIGTHGVGGKCSNALSDHFAVWTFSEGNWWYTKFEKGNEIVKAGKSSLRRPIANWKQGTIIQFTPDKTMFVKNSTLSIKDVVQWATITSYMNPGLELSITYKNKTKVFKSINGAIDLIDKRVQESKATLLGKTLSYTSKTLDLCLAFTDCEGSNLASHTNTVYNLEGGVHTNALWTALHNSLKDYKGKYEFTPTDLKEGIIGVLNYKIASPRFDSQTKEKLVDDRVAKPCQAECEKALSEFWSKNKGLAKEVCKRASELRQATHQFQLNKKLLRQLKVPTSTKAFLPGKLAGAPHCKVEDREIYAVEGESAGGCFTKNTRVLLENGTFKTFEDLVHEDTLGIVNRGIGYDIETGLHTAFDIIEPRITKVTTQLVKITLQDDTVFTCTPDHLILTTIGYVEAQSLNTTHDIVSALPYMSKIKSIKHITCAPTPVYDLTNPVNSNFALANGCIVHNSSKLARNRHNQEIFYLKGKIINALKNTDERVLASQEVIELLQSIGIDLTQTDVYSKVRVGKVILLADPDEDGKHINTLVLTLLYKYVPKLFSQGKVYIVYAYEYTASFNGKRIFGHSVDDIKKQCKGKTPSDILHLKGWGECPPELLRHLAFNPETRQLIKIQAPSKSGSKEFELIMSEDTAYRKQMLGV